MTLAELQIRFLDYATTEVIPSLPTVPLNVFGMSIPVSPSLMQFGAGLGITMSTFNLEKYAPQLQSFGILDENNVVDDEKLITGLREQIAKVGNLKIGSFEFDSNDVEKLITYLK